MKETLEHIRLRAVQSELLARRQAVDQSTPEAIAVEIDKTISQLREIRDRVLAKPGYLEDVAAYERAEAAATYERNLLKADTMPPRLREFLSSQVDENELPWRRIKLVEDLERQCERKRLILVTGDNGTGKSAAAAHILGLRGGWYVSARRYAEAHKSFDMREKALITGARAAGCLVIDDMGREHDVKGGLAIIEDLLWLRYDLGRTTLTIGTFNGSWQNFTATYRSARLVKRFQEVGIVITGTEVVRPNRRKAHENHPTES